MTIGVGALEGSQSECKAHISRWVESLASWFSLGVLLSGGDDFLRVLRRLPVILELIVGLVSREAHFTFEYLGHD